VSVRNPFLRSGLTVAAVAAVAVAGVLARGLQANGVFSSFDPGFSGRCKAVPVTGVADIAVDAPDRLAFLAVMDARRPGPGDGIFTYDLSPAPKLKRLPGTPADFHPRGIGLYRAPDGGLLLLAVNHRSSGRFSIDSFQVTQKDGARALAAQGTVEGGLLADPQDVVVVAPNNFYVSNGITGKNAVTRLLQSYGILAGGDIVYFDGTAFREVVSGLPGGRGLALTQDGSHVIAAAVTGRSLISLSREPFRGNLTQAGQLALPVGPDRLTMDGNTLWVAGHADLLSWRHFGRDPDARAGSQIFRVRLSGGVPESAEQVYGNDGGEIAGAAVGAALGKRLLIGSPLDGKLLDCAMK
jgi:hypothetical protein